MRPDITGALDIIIGSWADEQDIPVAWPNVSFDPPNSGEYLKVHDMPATPYSIDLAGKSKVYPGVFQVTAIFPVNIGSAKPRARARSIAALFPEGREITGNGFTGWVTSEPTIFAGIEKDTSYSIPISINYRVDVYPS
ncbi:phage tail terminator-like protein [Limnobaculum xujianqingii]|uniref:phage tail terminator-like protein n=1 Tax=Limnobaculum xujianqingii TaxID=2738837 RepID=UPI00112A737A|nr:phage tail terminator-like protein [Limnobaculum xujianqingii]